MYSFAEENLLQLTLGDFDCTVDHIITYDTWRFFSYSVGLKLPHLRPTLARTGSKRET